MPYEATVRVNPSVESGSVPSSLFGWQHGEVADPIFRGLWAEMLSNRKFGGHDEPAARQRTATVIAHIRTDVFHEYLEQNPEPPAFGVVNPWYCVAGTGAPYFCHDNSVWYVGGQSQRVELDGADGWCGVGQAGLLLAEGDSYTGYVVARAEGRVQMRVGLGPVGDGELETIELGPCGDEWERREFTFTPPSGTDNAEFRIEVSGEGTTWFGVVSLMPSSHRDGFRVDMLDAVSDLRPAIIRWGGNTSQYYRWEDGVGPRDLRDPFLDAWDSLISHDFGTREFVDHCRKVGAQPLLIVNAGDGTPEEARRWVEYCNAPADRGEGRLRAEHGDVEPLGVRLWSIGNEVYGNWVIGHCDPETYGRRARRFAEEIRTADPDIALLLVGDFDDPEWNLRALRHAGPGIDYLSLHWYPTIASRVSAGQVDDSGLDDDEKAVLARIAAFASRLEDRLRDAHEEIESASDNPAVGIALDEWSLMLQVTGKRPQRERWGRVKDMRDAVFVASAMNVLLRDPDLVAISTYTRLHRYGIYSDQRGFFYSPDVLALNLLREEVGSVSVETAVKTPGVNAGIAESVAALDVSATRGERDAVVVVLVNRDPERRCVARVDVNGGRYRCDRYRVLTGRSPADANTMEKPTSVTVRNVPPPELDEIDVPPWSVAVLRAIPDRGQEKQ